MSTVSNTRARRTELVGTIQRTVQYHAFDVASSPATNGKDFGARMAHLQAIIVDAAAASKGLLRAVPFKAITSIPEAFAARDEYMADGYEGAMLRRDGAPYAHGKRSAHLLKLKCMRDAEYQIVGTLEGQGKMANSLGAFVCQTSAGATFTVAPSIDEDSRRALWLKAQTLIGSALTVQFQELSSQGIPRFPVGKAIRGASMEATTWL
eukprot:GDKJ01049931.1.p1 GENE.GDKJ01049931.1~~GDKJ01049931.1.p1  ORF type:complete len:220 (+),score=-6.81 GDKJ01049931.1:39-662(+)